jgi:hypothetical protein
MAGSIVVNFHEGSRAEYLAQYFFSGFGTSIPVPHQEDSGIDLYCTMTEKLGRLAWPKAYFTVQVKSTDGAWEFNGRESVRWLIEQPLPLYLCVVDKSELRFRVYHTLARFHIRSLAIHSLEYLRLTPGPTGKGKCTSWDGGPEMSLDAPILDVALTEFLQGKRAAETREVLKYWLDLDKANLARITTGTLNFDMPQSYETNSITWVGQTASRTFGKQYANVRVAELSTSIRSLHEPLLWLARAQMKIGDPVGAALAAMLMRYWDPEDFDFYDIAMTLSHMAGLTVPLYFSPDELNRFLDELIVGVRERLQGVLGGRADEPPKS